MRGINHSCFGGNLTMDPEVRYTPKGNAVVNFSIASNRVWTNDNGEKQEEVCFMRCTAWNKGGETIAEYLSKGDPLYVEGYMKTNTWEDKETGAKRSNMELVVQNFTFLGSGDGQRQSTDAPPPTQSKDRHQRPSNEGATHGTSQSNAHDAGPGGYEDDDIPF